jgi:hypothetical protein
VYAELVGDLLLAEFGDVQPHRPPSPFGQRLASASLFGQWSYSHLFSGLNPPEFSPY